MNLFITFFAAVFAKFKQKNPAIAGIIALVLIVAVYTAEQGTALGAFTLPTWAAEAVKTVSLLLLAVNGAHTSEFLRK
jgi:hypothetical protein